MKTDCLILCQQWADIFDKELVLIRSSRNDVDGSGDDISLRQVVGLLYLVWPFTDCLASHYWPEWRPKLPCALWATLCLNVVCPSPALHRHCADRIVMLSQ